MPTLLATAAHCWQMSAVRRLTPAGPPLLSAGRGAVAGPEQPELLWTHAMHHGQDGVACSLGSCCAVASPQRAAVTMCAAPNEPSAINATAPITVRERLRLFWRLAVPYFENAEGAKLNFGLMLLLVLINSGISVIFSFVGRDFYSALSAKDQALFLEKTANFAIGLAVATPLTVLYKFQRQRLALNWREWMTTELARQYYSDQSYYKIEMDREIDNPDQRITEDVAAFTKVSLDFFITLTTSVINLISFSGILYSIYPELFYAIFAYAGFGTISTIQIGKVSHRLACTDTRFSRDCVRRLTRVTFSSWQALVGQSAAQLLREADLRYSLVRLRENAESIAFFRGEAQEESEVRTRLVAQHVTPPPRAAPMQRAFALANRHARPVSSGR